MKKQDYHFDFRPESYWDHANPLAAILCNIKGANRREMIEDIVTGKVADMTDNEAIRVALQEVEPGLLEESLDDEDRVGLGRIHPSFMGGEYLPDYGPGEVEIARLTLASTTRDVYSIRAHLEDGNIHYSGCNEYDSEFYLQPECTPCPLDFRAMIGLIDTMGIDDIAADGSDFVTDFYNYMEAEYVPGFITVTSDFYPELVQYYREKEDRWLRDRWVCYEGETPWWIDGDESCEEHEPGSYEHRVLADKIGETGDLESLRDLLKKTGMATTGVWRAVARCAVDFDATVLDRVIRDPENRAALLGNERLDDAGWAQMVFLALQFNIRGTGSFDKHAFCALLIDLYESGLLERYEERAAEKYASFRYPGGHAPEGAPDVTNALVQAYLSLQMRDRAIAVSRTRSAARG